MSPLYAGFLWSIPIFQKEKKRKEKHEVIGIIYTFINLVLVCTLIVNAQMSPQVFDPLPLQFQFTVARFSVYLLCYQ